MAAFVATSRWRQQRRDAFVLSRDHPAIRYSSGDLDNPVVRLNERLAEGEVRLTYDAGQRLPDARCSTRSAIPVSSQTLVFSKTSFQADLVTMHNPRAIYFGDDVFVGWVRGAEVLEIAAADRRQGSIFYTLATEGAAASPDAPVTLERKTDCLACHLSWDTRGVPGLMTTSMYPLPDDPNAYANGFSTVQGSPLEQRWGGWWVTGDTGGAQHMGNIPVMPAEKNFGASAQPQGAAARRWRASSTSRAIPRRRATWWRCSCSRTRRPVDQPDRAARLGSARGRGRAVGGRVGARREAAAELADSMLFLDEAPLPGPVHGSSGFAECVCGAGPARRQGPIAARSRPAHRGCSAIRAAT